MVSLAFTEHLGSFAGKLLSIATVLFAFSTVLGWSSYASVAIEYLFGKKAIKFYFIICGVLAFVGSVLKIEVVWTLSDIFNGLMAIPNIIALIALSGVAEKETLKIPPTASPNKVESKA